VTQPVASPEQYRRRARHFFQMAQNCKDSQIADRLRVIASDYLDAGQDQRQKQVQSDKKAPQ
jgi:hypothetical protein